VDSARRSSTDAPLLLAVETATAAPSLALWRGDALVAERRTDAGRTTAEALLPALDALLAGAGASLAEVAAFAVSIGPGSFTGLRVGVATVKGLAFGTARPALAVSTLAAVARHAPGPEPVAAVLDARRGEVYAAGFESGLPAAWLPEGVVAIAALAGALPAGCRIVGEGAALCEEALRGKGFAFAPPPHPETTARHVAALGARAWVRGEAIAAADLVPRYWRRAEAEVKRTGLHLEPL
jgi:tRNA threonylcarbamoyladenosine biosynthesis protein TsaB